MTDFKAGDIVTFDIEGLSAWQGGQGVVKFRHKGTWNDGYYEVEVTEVPEENPAISEGHTTSFKSEWLTLIRSAPKFKAGDMVKSIGFQYNAFEGKQLVVEGNYGDGDKGYPYRVRAVGESWIPGHCFREDELELVEDSINFIHNPGFRVSVPNPTLDFYPKTEDSGFFDGETADPVNNPSHYTQYPVEVIELTRHMPFDEGNVVKYVARAPFKGNKVQDLKKARWYLDDAIKQAELEEAK